MTAAPTSLPDFRACLSRLPAPDEAAIAAARARDAVLTKPPGALGRLEEVVAWLAGWQGRGVPRLDIVQVAIFAGNHGVAARGVSAFPAEVTVQMVANFDAGARRSTSWPAPSGPGCRCMPCRWTGPRRISPKLPP